MISQTARNAIKRALAWSNVKLIYTRITLTKYTTAYFFLALIYCLALVVLQSVVYADTATARNAVSSVVGCINFDGLVVNAGNQLEWCDGLPSVRGTNCTVLQSEGANTFQQVQMGVVPEVERRGDHQKGEKGRKDEDEDAQPITNELGDVVGVDYKGVVLSIQCARSFHWLNDTLQDSVREDITILLFHVWLFALAFVTILNESLPHLVSGLAGHALVTSWAAFRVGNGRKMRDMYYSLILNGTCASSGGAQVDILGTQWWEIRNIHGIPTVSLNAASLALVGILSLKLYKVYARHSFERVGTSPQVHSIYKLVLVLSSLLQLAGFFVLASTIMWIDKASNGAISRLAKHLHAYMAVLIVVIIFVIPWLVLGWESVRREQRRLFWAFFVISLVFLATTSACFGSNLYRFIFSIWPLFATMTIISYVLIVAINVMGIVCRYRFVKQTDTLEGADFAPVYISQFPPPSPDDEEGKMDFSDNTFRTIDFLPAVPARSYHDSTPRPAKQQDTWQNYERPIPTYSEKSFYDYNGQHDMVDSVTVTRGESMKTVRMSVFNDPTRDTVKLSTTPPVARGDVVVSSAPEPVLSQALKVSKSKRKESVKKMVIGLPSNPRKDGNPIERSGGDYF